MTNKPDPFHIEETKKLLDDFNNDITNIEFQVKSSLKALMEKVVGNIQKSLLKTQQIGSNLSNLRTLGSRVKNRW